MYRLLTDLADVLRRYGCNVIEWDGWQHRGRPSSTGDFDPHGILCHHTASPDSWSDEQDIAIILAGNSEAPGPISQLYQSRHAPWPIYVLAAGRANHGGRGTIGFGCQDMNALLIGIEAGQSGSTYWPDGMTDHYARVVAALVNGYAWEPSNVHLHHETGPPCSNFKVDPSGPWQLQPELPLNNPSASMWDLATWRNWVATHLRPPSPSPTEDNEMFILTHVARPEVSWLIIGGYRCRLDGVMAYGSPEHPEKMVGSVPSYWTGESIEQNYPLVPGATPPA